MLKWLVTKSVSNPEPIINTVTDDPLATLTRRGQYREPIYAVSRINPIFQDDLDDGKKIDGSPNVIRENTKQSSEIQEQPESPGTDRESVRSSGYGSKEADGESVSLNSEFPEDTTSQSYQELGSASSQNQESSDPNTATNNSKSVAEITKSFENLVNSSQSYGVPPVRPPRRVGAVASKNKDFVKNIEISTSSSAHLEAIPEVNYEMEPDSLISKKSSWSKMTHLAEAVQKQTHKIYGKREKDKLKKLGREYELSNDKENINKNQVLRFHPLVSVVAQNEHYVTAISLSPNKNVHPENDHKSKDVTYKPSEIQNSSRTKLTISKSDTQGDKCFTTRYFANKGFDSSYPLLTIQPDSLVTEETLKMMTYPDHEMYDDYYVGVNDNFHLNGRPNFSKALYSGTYSSLSHSSMSHNSQYKKSLSNSFRHHAKRKKGLSVVKDLWEKSGMKTNGRKLIVDVCDSASDDIPGTHSRISSYGAISATHARLHDVSNQAHNNIHYGHNYGRASSTHSYEEIPDSLSGIDNVCFVSDKECSRGSAYSSMHSRSSHSFQHSLTEFQKRMSERIKGEPDHRTVWIDLERGNDDQEFHGKNLQNRMENRLSEPLSKYYSVKAIRHLGLDDRTVESKDHFEGLHLSKNTSIIRPIVDSTENHSCSGEFGGLNRAHIWEKLKRYQRKGTFVGQFKPHPNREAPIFAHHSCDIHDFTLDPKRSHRLRETSRRAERRRKCCISAIVLFGLTVFVCIVVGIGLHTSFGWSV